MALDSAPAQHVADDAQAAEGDPAEETAIEEASVIHLLRVLVAEAAPPVQHDVMETNDSSHPPVNAHQQEVTDVTCEEAGCLLWDMSASRPVARVMLRNRALEALEIVIARELQVVQSSPDKEAPKATATRPGLQGPSGAAGTVDTANGGTAEDGNTPNRDADVGSGRRDGPAGQRGSPVHSQAHRHRHRVQNALRILEICLGTLANLIVTQPAAAAAVSGRPEMLALLLLPPKTSDEEEDEEEVAAAGGKIGAGGSGSGGGALYVDDARVLSELFRLFGLALRCQGASLWLEALSSGAVVHRLMWVGTATADTQLFARFLDLLVALLHAASGETAAADAAGSAVPSGREGPEPQAAAAAEPAPEDVQPGVAAPPTAAAPSAVGSGAACCRVLLDCGLLALLHQVLLQALRACMPAEEKYGELGGGDPDVYDGGGSAAADSPQRGAGASPPSAISGARAAHGRRTAAASTTTHTDAPRTPPTDGGSGRQAAAPAGARPAAAAGPGGDTPAADLPPAGRAGADEDNGPGMANSAAAVAATWGPVPLSDEAVDAALRLLEELVSSAGPLVAPDGSSNSAVEALLQLHAEGGFRPGLMQLLLGLLRYQYDSMQVVEGLLVVLVDLGPAVQQAVAAASPEQAVAVVARLVELLQDSCYSPADRAPSAVVQLQQGAWYLLAATLRGALAQLQLAAATAAAATPPPPPPAWQAHWPSLERSLRVLPELPRPEEGCSTYTRACAVAGLQLLDRLLGPPPLEDGAVAGQEDAAHSGGRDGAGSRRVAVRAMNGRAAAGAVGPIGDGSGGGGQASWADLGVPLQAMVAALQEPPAVGGQD